MSKDNALQISDVNDILTALPKVDADTTFWMIRANKGEYYTDFVTSQYVGIGYEEITLQESQNNSNDNLSKLFHDRKPRDDEGRKIPDGTYTSWIGQLKRFGNEIQAGDYVLVPSIASERFSLGIVLGEPYELTPEQLKDINSELIPGRKKSPYRKRIKIQFLSSFNRAEADPALYKMIYTQTTVSKINKYALYILRAVFDAYVSGNKVYLTFPVTQKEDIRARPYTAFTYFLTESYVALNQESEPIIKNNVQSAGIVQFIIDLAPYAGLFGMIWVLLKANTGFQIEVSVFKGKFKLTKEDKGIVAERIEDSKSKRTINEQKAEDEHLKRLLKIIELANKADIPMDSIKADVPSKLKEAVKKAAKPDDENDQE
ncbi:hypothetical protein [Lactobacillus parabuchneri] [Lactiplantibacillus mudanjiangensis]|uniref:hypothetical protein n=1 Tax=Lactiplantibacillus mudanjiangensis TaxID=1296538 RepID=UPI00101468AB|nr:hypothetical protein [Lactobacillus parabuchneri] [Lactiplantibacillus mudanjiangensis]